MLKQEKQNLRVKFKEIRRSFPLQLRRELEKQAAENLFKLEEYRTAKLVLCYWSIGDEIDTRFIINKLWENNVPVALPRCLKEPGMMDFYIVNSPDELISEKFQLLEPDPALCKKVTDFSSSFCIVPALACDKNGHRLGYGGGYYDRFLQNYLGKSAALIFSDCFTDNLPTGYFDKAVDYVATEKRIIKIK